MKCIKLTLFSIILVLSSSLYADNFCRQNFGNDNVKSFKNYQLEKQAIEYWTKLKGNTPLLISKVAIGKIKNISIYLDIHYDPVKKGLIFKTVSNNLYEDNTFMSVSRNINWGEKASYKYSETSKKFTITLTNYSIPYFVPNSSLKNLKSNQNGFSLKKLMHQGFSFKEYRTKKGNVTVSSLTPEKLVITGQFVASKNQTGLFAPGSTSIAITSKFLSSYATTYILHEQPNERFQKSKVTNSDLESIQHNVFHYFSKTNLINIPKNGRLIDNPYPTASKIGINKIPPELKKYDITRQFYKTIFETRPALSEPKFTAQIKDAHGNVYLTLINE